MKLLTKILILIVAGFLAGTMVVNACGDEKIKIRAEEEEIYVDSSPDFPMVNALIKF